MMMVFLCTSSKKSDGNRLDFQIKQTPKKKNKYNNNIIIINNSQSPEAFPVPFRDLILGCHGIWSCWHGFYFFRHGDLLMEGNMQHNILKKKRYIHNKAFGKHWHNWSWRFLKESERSASKWVETNVVLSQTKDVQKTVEVRWNM